MDDRRQGPQFKKDDIVHFREDGRWVEGKIADIISHPDGGEFTYWVAVQEQIRGLVLSESELAK